MSSVFTNTFVRAISDAMVDHGKMAAWPTDKIAQEVCDKIAAQIPFDAVPDGGLSRDDYMTLGNAVKTARDRLSAAGYGATAEAVAHAKTAASKDLGDRAAQIAAECMNKAAAETLMMGGGQHANTPEAAAAHDQMTRLDQKNRPQGTYLVGVGNTEMPQGGVVGKELPHPKAPGATDSTPNSVTEHSQKAASLPAELASTLLSAKEAQLAALALGKSAEEMPTADLAGAAGGGAGPAGAPGGAPPGGAPQGGGAPMLAKLKMLMDALKAKFQGGGQPSPEASVATAGLAQHPNGMEVMAMVLDRSKTAEEADDLLQQILSHQGQVGQLASPELVQALQALLQEGGHAEPDGDEADPNGPHAAGAVPPAGPAAPPAGAAGGDVAKSAAMRDLVGKLNPFKKHDKKENGPESNAPPMTGGGSPPDNAKSASLMAILKRASEGSLTSTGANTPESAAKTDQTAELDQKNRSTSQYLTGQGKTDLPNKGQQYDVHKPAPAKDSPVSTDTTPSREAKNASLTEEEAEYVKALRKTAEVYGPKLPVAMSEQEKIAHLHKIHGLVPSERSEYVAKIQGR